MFQYRRSILVALGLLAVSAAGEVFHGTNAPGQAADFNFTVGAGVTNLSLSVSNTPSEYSHLLLRLGSPATDQSYDYIAQFDGRTNAINLQTPELSAGTWHCRVRTPATSGSQSFSIPVVTNASGMRSATYPVSKPQAFVTTGALTNEQWQYFRVEIPSNSPGWRLVLNSSGATPASLYVRKDYLPDAGNYLKVSSGDTNLTVTLTEAEAADGAYFVGVYQTPGSSSYTLYSEVGYLTELPWDSGQTHLGTQVFTNQSSTGGEYFFHVHTVNSAVQAWRTALQVTGGEADVYLRQGALPSVGNYHTESGRVGSDGFVLHSGQFNPGEDWYLMVKASPGASWTLMSGEAYVQDLGTLATNAASSSGPVPLGAEGYRFFKTTTPPETLAWRLWLSGSNNTIYVRKSACALAGAMDLQQNGQMLVVPDYLDVGTFNGSYFVGVPGAPGEIIALDSRLQPVADLPFPGTNTLAVTGYGYTTYRVQVPIEQIAWDVKVTPSSGNPNLAVRRDKVPNEWNNDAYSEVAGAVADSITLVPPTLSDGTFFITVYGGGSHTFTLTSRSPVVTDINFTSDTTNDDPNRSGWRYYRIVDIAQQLGRLGWDLLLTNDVIGTELTMRRNAVPGRWKYRQNGNSYLNSGHVDFAGPGFVQRPAHQADIWYIGVNLFSTNLGPFALVTRPLTAATVAFDNLASNVVNQPGASWRFFRVDVPTNTLGWDIRVGGVTAGVPRPVVRRDQLPTSVETYGDFPGNPGGWCGPNCPPSAYTNWPSGYQWAAAYDWTQRYYAPAGNLSEYGRILAMGMGNPLVAGTYYVGVYNDSSQSASYTLRSRGIGPGFAIPVVDLDYQAGSITNTLAPREAAYYRVIITNGTPSWKVRLDPTMGEALLQVQKDRLPNTVVYVYGSPYSGGGQRMSKDGKEHWVLLPDAGTNALANGTYYLLVAGEGQNPISGSHIGTGTSTYVLSSHGALGITNLGALGVADLVRGDSVEVGTFKAYQFTVPSNTLGIQVRLEGRSGNPVMWLSPGVLLPDLAFSGSPASWHASYGRYGGSPSSHADDDLVTIPNPAPGMYSLAVYGMIDASDAGYTVRVHAVTVSNVTFNGGTASVTNQPANEWRYFRVDVPTNALGWDIRLVNVSNGAPQMVVRRDQLPVDLHTYGAWGSYPSPTFPSTLTNWPSGDQWAAESDWTEWYYDPVGNAPAYGRMLAMGMGNPLEPGRYYIGVAAAGGVTDPMSYTVQSRGIGTGLAIPVPDLDFYGGSATNTLAPREGAFYRIIITNDTPSWRLRVVPTTGEVMMVVNKDYLPNIDQSWYPSTLNPSGGWRVQKDGPEQWLMLPPYEESPSTNVLRTGDYYVVVASEGQNPGHNSAIGSNSSTYVIQSLGSPGVTNLGTVGPVDLVQADSVEGGAAKQYRFNVPPDTIAMEVRLEGRVGHPHMKLRLGDESVRVWYYGTDQGYEHDGYGTHGGRAAHWHGYTLITIPSPASGIYRLTVNASDDDEGIYSGDSRFRPDASYTVRVHAVTATLVSFDGGTSAVSNQPANEWRYFRVDVPTNVLGWDIRLANVTSGVPQMVVRRDFLPSSLATAGSWGTYPNPNYPGQFTNWLSGNQWAADHDWTMRYYAPTGSLSENGRILAMGMGNPLEPGTYYIGVTAAANQTNVMSYTVQSRGIGTGMALPVVDLAFGNGSATNIVAPRDGAYYRIAITNDTPSWELRVSPTVGEAMCVVQKDVLPNVTPYWYQSTLSPGGGWRVQKDGAEQWLLLPPYEEGPATNVLRAGDYYIVVVGEGQNPLDGSHIGSGTSTFVIQSLGVQGVTNLGTLGAVDLTQPDSVEGGAANQYTFTVSPGTAALEVRLENRVGHPIMKLVAGDETPRILYYSGSGFLQFEHDRYGSYGGRPSGWHDYHLITIPNPAGGIYRLMVNASDDDVGVYTTDTQNRPDATYTLRVRAHAISNLNFTASLNTNGLTNAASGVVVDQQSGFYRIDVPAAVNGQPVVGWRLTAAESQGVAFLRVRQDLLPDNTGDTSPFAQSELLLAPPFLTAGTWYVEIKGNGHTAYTLTSSSFEPIRPAWNMPALGQPITTPGLTSTPWFGDTGVDPNGVALPGDQGIDLGEGKYHYYAISVPTNGAVLLRTMLEAINGDPNLFIRAGYPPTFVGGSQYERSLQGTGTEYGNWVPSSGRYERFLTNGTWYLAVRADGNANCRYRLRVSTGAVQDLAQNGGSFAGQSLAEGDWRYYRVVVPTNAPASWNVAFSQQSGDVIMYLRDLIPPGQYSSPSDGRDWANENDSKNDGPYGSFDPPGTHSFGVQPIRPGSVYYLGFYAVNDAVFSVTSSVSGSDFAAPILLPYTGGSDSTVIGANSAVVYRIDVPTNAAWLRLTNTHASSVQLYFEQGTLPYLDGRADRSSAGSTDYIVNEYLISGSYNWPWKPGYSYYVVATNTSGGAESFSIQTAGSPDQADVGLSAVASPGLVLAGEQGRITLTVTNHGPETASVLSMTNVLPVGLTLLAVTSEVGSVSGAGPVLWGHTNLPAGGSLIIEMIFMAPDAGVFTNRATLSSTTADPSFTDNSATALVVGVAVSGDHDGDGLPNGWEDLFFSGVTNGRPGDDPDGDNWVNQEEFIADTVPTNAGAHFPSTYMTNSPGGSMVLVLSPTSTGRVYSLRWATNLLQNPQVWTLHPPEKTGTGSAVTFFVTNDAPDRVYRTGVRLP